MIKAESIAEVPLIASVILLSVKFKLNVGVSEVFVKLKEKFWEKVCIKAISSVLKVGFVITGGSDKTKSIGRIELLLAELLLAELLLVGVCLINYTHLIRF